MCKQCASDLVLTSDFKACKAQIEKCTLYQTSSAQTTLKCDECVASHLITQDFLACAAEIADCVKYTLISTDSVTCAACEKDFLLSTDASQCFKEIPHCVSHSVSASSATCSACQPGYSPYSNASKCGLLPPFCDSLKATSNSLLCSSCASGYTQSHDQATCLYSAPNCKQHAPVTASSSEELCSQCSDGFISFESQSPGHCVADITNCSSPAFKSLPERHAECSSCAAGFHPTANKTLCLAEISECQQYMDSDSTTTLKCLGCSSGKIPTDDSLNCVDEISDCEVYETVTESQTFCLTCAATKVRTQDKSHCLNDIDNCEHVISTGNTLSCQSCKTNFYLYSNSSKCGLLPAECTELDNALSQPRCTVCNIGYKVNPVTFQCDEVTELCQQYSDTQTDKCEQCVTGYLLFNNQSPGDCIGGILKCSNYSFATTPDNHSLCEACEATFFKTDDKLKCLPEIAECSVYEASTKDDAFLKCSNCGAKEITDNKKYCVAGIAFCTVYQTISSSSVVCQTCQNGKIRSQDGSQCLDSIPQCKNYTIGNDSLTCFECESGYGKYDSSSKCGLLTTLNCVSLDNSSSSLKCIDCRDGEMINPVSFRCVVTTSNCTSYESHTASSTSYLCQDCADFFMLFEGTNPGHCVQKIAECQNYGFQASPQRHAQCSLCNPSFSATNDKLKCLASIADCEDYTANSETDSFLQCETCLSSHRVTDDKRKCLPQIADCGAYAASNLLSFFFECSTCAASHMKTSDSRKCLPQIAECSEYQNSSVNSSFLECKACAVNFSLTGDKRKCLASITNCSAYLQSTFSSSFLQCSGCETSFTKTSDNRACLAQIANCDELEASTFADSFLECKVCTSDHSGTADKRKCLPSIANCSALEDSLVDTAQHLCKTCAMNFRLTNDQRKCLSTIANCGTYKTSSEASSFLECSVCSTNFKATDDARKCFSQIGNCSDYNTSSVSDTFLECKICSGQNLPTSDFRQCLPLILECGEYKNSTLSSSFLECQSCLNSKIPTSDSRNCVLPIASCENYSSLTVSSVLCEKCADGTQKVQDASLCLADIPNCQTHATSGSALTCGTCNDSFGQYSSSSKCGALPTECLELNNDLGTVQCKTCQTGFALNLVSFKCLETTSNCSLFETDTDSSTSKLCLNCASGFLRFENKNPGHCVAEVPSCHTHSFADSPARHSLCDSCETNLAPTDDKKKCLTAIADCSKYEASTEADMILQCETCSGSKIPTTDKLHCVESIANCGIYQSLTQSSVLCSICAAGYALVQDKTLCPAEIFNCTKHESTGNALTCSECANTFDLYDSSTKCGLLPESCTALDNTASTIKCLTCASNYDHYDSSTKCGLLSSNCLNLDNAVSSVRCSECASGFDLSSLNFKCLETTSNCDTYETQTVNSTSNLCNECATNYILYKGSEPGHCVAAIEHCSSYSYFSSPERHALCSACAINYQFTTSKKLCLAAIENCATYETDSIVDPVGAFLECQSCKTDFLRTPDKQKCLAEIPNCAYYKALANSDSSVSCIECRPNFYLSTANGCVFESSFCAVHNSTSGICSSCESNYFFNSGDSSCYPTKHQLSCASSVDYVTRTSWPHPTCSSCETGKVLSLLSECYANENSVTDCLGFKSKAAFLQPSSGACLSCANGKVLNTQLSKCLSPQPDCWEQKSTSSDDSSLACRVCDYGKRLADDGQSCRDYTFEDGRYNCTTGASLVCDSCAFGYEALTNPDNFSNKVCYPTIEGCLKYVSIESGDNKNTKCVACASGLTLSKGRCSGVAGTAWENCLNMQDESTCSVCKIGYKIVGSKCQKRVDLGAALTFEVQNTSQKVHPTSCVFAQYSIKTIKDSVSNTQVEVCVNAQCTEFSATSGECTVCDASSCASCSNGEYNLKPTRLSDNSIKCLQDSKCKIFNSDHSCKECQSGFQNLESGCADSDSLVPTVSNCRVRNQVSQNNAECLLCEDNYEVKNGSCVYKNTDCALLDSCSSCKTGYAPTTSADYSTCEPVVSNCSEMKTNSATECLTCKMGYSLTNANTKCSIKSENSASFPFCTEFFTNSSGDVCTDCADGYLLYDFLGQCVSSVPHCTSYSNASTCSGCSSGYSLLDGMCVNDITFCKEYLNASNCLLCYEGYTTYDDVTTGFLKHCKLIIPMTGCDHIWSKDFCFKCKAGYALENNKCTPSMSIDSFTSSGVCTSDSECKASHLCHTLSGECRPKNCLAFHDSHSSKCKTCALNFQLIDTHGFCESKLANCDAPSSSLEGSCDTCAGGYTKKT